VAPRRRFANLEPRRGGGPSLAANKLRNTFRLGGGEAVQFGNALDFCFKIGRGIDDEEGSGGPLDVENRRRADGGDGK
jgi:hypothetical protein